MIRALTGSASNGSSHDHTTKLLVIGAAITAAFCSVFLLEMWESRNRDRDQARLAAENVIAAMSSEIERNLELYSLSLDAVADGLTLPDIDAMPPELRQRVLFDRAATAKDMGSIFVLDRNGTLKLDSRILAPMPEDHSEKDYFIVQRNIPTTGIYLSRPWRTIDGDYIGISRAIVDEKGNFTGTVVGTLRLSYFRTMFEGLNLGKSDSLILLREDGTVLMRGPDRNELIGQSVARSPVFTRIASYPSGSFEDVGRIDQARRLFVFRRVAEYPLILSYNRATEAIYADWRQRAWQFGTLIAILCAINMSLLAVLGRSLRKKSLAEARLATMASTDGLTGLANRRALDETFAREWRRAMRDRIPLSLVMVDADHFKSYNDSFGHQAGDAALVALAECLKGSARRAADLAARYGGEEFALLLPGLSIAEAADHAEAIRARVLALRADQQGRPDSTPTVSIGVASMIPRQGLEPRDLIRAADSALYEAKSKGRNRVEQARFPAVIAA
jgi:diguanylate cyclase (GGDEF)-like protein